MTNYKEMTGERKQRLLRKLEFRKRKFLDWKKMH